MSKIYLIYLSALFVFTNSAITDSPCPNIFQYGYGNNGLYGIITLETYPKDRDILLSVQFSIPDKIAYLGSIVPLHSGTEINSILDNNDPLRFQLNFPQVSSTPTINSISVNEDIICYSYNEIPGYYKVTLKYNLLSYTDKMKQINKQKEVEQRYSTGISPCPDIFQYDSDFNGVSGLITLNYPAYSHVGGNDIILKVEYSVSRKLPSDNLGSIEMLDSLKNSYSILRRRGSFRYRLHFPLEKPLPWINSIEINGRLICAGPKESGGIYTSPITLTHRLTLSKDIQKILNMKRPIEVVNGASPCPDVFQYKKDLNFQYGLITLHDTQYLLDEKITIGVQFSVLDKLDSDYFGKIDLIEDVNTAYAAIKQNGPLHYKLLFPVQTPLPWINNIKVNDRIICSGSTDYGNYYTGPIILNNTLFFYKTPSGPQRPHQTSRPFIPHTIDIQQEVERETFTNIRVPVTPQYNIPSKRPSISIAIPPKPKPKPTSETKPIDTTENDNTNNKDINYYQNFNLTGSEIDLSEYERIKTTTKITIKGYINPDICGSANEIVPLTTGRISQRGAYPWLSALYKQSLEGSGLNFICAGNLITTKHVLTAAHCIGIRNPDNYLVGLGKYDLTNFKESQTQLAEIMKLFVHPDYQVDEISHQDADIAILTLKEDVKYTNFIRPVCVFPEAMPIPINKEGMIAGWGEDEDGNRSAKLKETSVTIVSEETCISSNKKFKEIITNRTFCAGGGQAGRACRGDSGGGLFIPQGGKFYLRGIISASIGTNCDSFVYSVFTDVTKFFDWITNNIQN